MSTWKTLARKTNSLPPGWSTADEIAADLDCEPNEVPKILASAISAKLVEKQSFPHWQPGSRQLLYQTGYRQIPASANRPPSSAIDAASVPGIPAELLPKIRAAIARWPNKRPGQIADLFKHKHRIPAALIRPLMPS